MPDDTLTQIAASLQRIADRLEAMAPAATKGTLSLWRIMSEMTLLPAAATIKV